MRRERAAAYSLGAAIWVATASLAGLLVANVISWWRR